MTKYNEGIRIKEETWKEIEKDGCERIDPTVSNDNTEILMWKPENEKSGLNPDCSYILPAKKDLYVGLDAIRTPTTPEGQIFRVPSSGTVHVDESGNATMSNTTGKLFEKISPFTRAIKKSANYGNVKRPDDNYLDPESRTFPKK